MVLFDKHFIVKTTALFLLLKFIKGSGLGKCPKIPYMPNFNQSKFTGRWYEIERSFYLVQLVSACVSVDLTENSKGQLEVDVQTRSLWTGDFTVSEGVALRSKRDPSILMYKVVSKLPKLLGRYLPGAGVYQIIDTDYENYTILWSCTSYGLAHTDLIWIWGRRQELDANYRAKIYEHLETLFLDSERLFLPRNGNCSNV